MIRQSKNEGALWKRFRGMTESIGPMCRHILLPQLLSRFPVGRVPGYRTCRKEHALPIVRDEFRPAIPRRVARQRCPSPLHRHHQLKTIAASNGMIYHRTAPSLLTGCLTPGDKRTEAIADQTLEGWDLQIEGTRVCIKLRLLILGYGEFFDLRNEVLEI